MNDMKARANEVAAMVRNWGEILNHFGISHKVISKNQCELECCNCGGRIVLTKNKNKYPTWICSAGCHRQWFDSFAGLIRLFSACDGKEISPGRVLGLIEAYELEKHRAGNLPDEAITFGKYQGRKWADVPANYLKWLVEKNIVKGDLQKLIAVHLNVDVPEEPTEELIAF
jgi:uncharacterized protein (DUF3820 family)